MDSSLALFGADTEMLLQLHTLKSCLLTLPIQETQFYLSIYLQILHSGEVIQNDLHLDSY